MKRKEEVNSMSEKLEIRNPAISLKGTHGEVLIGETWRKFVCSTTFGTVYSPVDGYEFSTEIQESILERTKKAESKLFK